MQSRSEQQKKRSAGAIRLCPACQCRYIMGFDLHPRCEACLGAEHAGLALTARASCTFCALLPLEELQRRADGFMSQQRQGEGDGSWGDRATFSVEEAMAILDEPGVGTEQREIGHGPIGSFPSLHGPPPGSPLSPVGDLEGHNDDDDDIDDGEREAVQHTPVKDLLLNLPAMIKTVADLKDIPMPVEPPAPASGVLGVAVGGPGAARKPPPLWPRVPALRSFADSAFTEPGKLKAPVSHYEGFTRVDGQTSSGYPSVPPLDESLVTILLPKDTFFGRRKPTPPSPCDQVTARLTDWAHQCAAQSVAAANNIALLASSVSAMVAQPGALPPEVVSDIRQAMATVVTLSTALTVAQAHIMAWQTMLQRNTWLHMSVLPVPLRRELLGGPISPDGLFGPLLQSTTDHIQAACEEAERVKKHTSWGKATPCPQRPHGSWNERREARGKPRRPAAAAAPRPVPAQPPAPTAQHSSRRT